jgi:cell division septum initiation protein DivIVA
MEILGLLDTLEAMILDGFKIPFSSKTMINEEKLLAVIDKMRLVVQGGEDFAKRAIDRDKKAGAKTDILDEVVPKKTKAVAPPAQKAEGQGDVEGKAIEVLQQAYQIAKEVRQGADKYADDVLSNLEATSSRILRSIRAGRDRLSRVIGEGRAEEPKSIADVLTKKEKKEEGEAS